MRRNAGSRRARFFASAQHARRVKGCSLVLGRRVAVFVYACRRRARPDGIRQSAAASVGPASPTLLFYRFVPRDSGASPAAPAPDDRSIATGAARTSADAAVAARKMLRRAEQQWGRRGRHWVSA